jgi:hypothetical protein
MKLPRARNTEIMVSDLGDELLIYDHVANKAFCLNETLKIVYEACDGKTTFDELKRENKKLIDEVILLSLDKLQQSNLLGEDFSTDVSRRSLLAKAAYSAIALPVLLNLIAPSAVHAASCVAGGGSCSLNNPAACCSQTCLNNGGNPICDTACTPAGGSCSLNDPGACCSQTCLNNGGNPVCAPICTPNGGSCSLNNPAACCSQTCLNNGGNPICGGI